MNSCFTTSSSAWQRNSQHPHQLSPVSQERVERLHPGESDCWRKAAWKHVHRKTAEVSKQTFGRSRQPNQAGKRQKKSKTTVWQRRGRGLSNHEPQVKNITCSETTLTTHTHAHTQPGTQTTKIKQEAHQQNKRQRRESACLGTTSTVQVNAVSRPDHSCRSAQLTRETNTEVTSHLGRTSCCAQWDLCGTNCLPKTSGNGTRPFTVTLNLFELNAPKKAPNLCLVSNANVNRGQEGPNLTAYRALTWTV